ncbi:MAG: hypothetical protein ACJ0BN_16395 [Limisphaerales bacterium]
MNPLSLQGIHQAKDKFLAWERFESMGFRREATPGHLPENYTSP